MIRSLPRSKTYDFSFNCFIVLYFIFLFAPLVVTCVLAFNDSNFPSLPWQGFSLDWFVADGPDRVGLFHDDQNLRAIMTSFKTAFFVSILSVVVGTCASFLFEQEEFRFKGVLYFLMLAPLVIPGVILGISLLLAANTAGTYFDMNFGIDVELFRPSFWLVVVGQFSFITTFVTLVVSARLRKFDHSLEEAALNLGATQLGVIWHITLKFLRPAIIGAGAVAFLMSFENFNTTLFLVGSEPTLPINLYLQVRDGSTPVINAVSLLLIVGTSLMALANFYFTKRGE
ncbi:Binding-protein-dependent transport systems inner membrane component [Pseudodesulfovibrio profundus]|uniref:Binding-protein-dependent transport systems inner membrane component n=1 Tax=Pseudodesulfovibrio profundus TaxID=57320 RepID=A0A2C8F6D6_9BACT|nr:ABC transporter permease [Pseudodesulfovibrio profundus]MBC17927.1 ABC transporter permease [Desulfovibrio sp.]SOB57990.1 Binding-protein-dependent transport systems inner membrane component [Pseudodesulfovibrio profundus]|tara:strand:- start:28772 stop:29626 length:855 start_codon:yes stop_codon:yes gene_type:complete